MNVVRGTSTRLLYLVALAVVTLACAANPRPQGPAPPGSPSWSALSSLSENQNVIIGLRPGHVVAGAVGDELVASFQEFDTESLVVRRGVVLPGANRPAGVTVLPRDQVLYVRTHISIPDSTYNGTVLGMFIGAAATVATVLALCTAENDCPAGYLSVITVPLGATAGAFTGRSYDRKRTETQLVTVYEASRLSRR